MVKIKEFYGCCPALTNSLLGKNLRDHCSARFAVNPYYQFNFRACRFSAGLLTLRAFGHL